MRGRKFPGSGERCPVPGGELRLLTAMEVLEARREGESLVSDGGERALCANACLLARALERRGKPVFPSGRAVLEGLRVEDIAALTARWEDFNRAHNPSPMGEEETILAAKKAWSTRLTRAFSGVCSTLSARCPRRNGPEA